MKVSSDITKKTLSLFLVTILITGAITTFFSILFMKEVNAAVSSDANYGLKMEEDKDNNNNYYYYSNYQSKYFPDKNEENIECTNFNLNANDFNIDDIPVSVRDLLNQYIRHKHPKN